MSHPWDNAPTVRMDFEEPADDEKRDHKGGKSASERIPVLPPAEKPLTGDERRRGISDRDRSAVNLKLDGASYIEIADLLEFETPSDARRAVESALAQTHAPEEWESLRMIAAARAERQLARSTAMAGADFLHDKETGEKLPNYEKLRWHQQAGVDLVNWARITGAQAPTKVEITPDEAKMEQLVSHLLASGGHDDVVEAEVLELEAIPLDEDDEDE